MSFFVGSFAFHVCVFPSKRSNKGKLALCDIGFISTVI